MNFDDQFYAKQISPFFTLLVDQAESSLDLTPEEEQAIELIWQQQQELSRGQLFNGKMLCFVALSQERMLGRFIDYKYYLAQVVEPSLAPILRIQPIAISGVTMVGDMVLCGRRAEQVTEYPHHFELVPSGGVDPSHENEEGEVDIQAQLLSELTEEAGIPQENIISINPIAWISDKQKESFEICMAIQAKPEAMDQTLPSSLEYDALNWISKDDLKKKALDVPWVPLSIYLIDNFL